MTVKIWRSDDAVLIVSEHGHLELTREEAEEAVRTLIRWAGDNPKREGLIDTPKRVAKAFGEFFKGYEENPATILDRIFEEVEGYDDLVLVRDIPFSSHCEHHMVPFVGRAHIAYYPSEGVVGLSKLARLVDAYARRLQVQERLTKQIADCLAYILKTDDVAVFIKAKHYCVISRGVEDVNSETITSDLRGAFKTNPETRSEFLSICR